MDDEGVRQLKAIMFTDIKGFSLMMGRDEELTVRLVREHRELVRAVLARHHGQERDTIGDAFLVLFDSAVNAVRCALEIQHRMRERNLERPEPERVWLRIGIHLGDIIVGDDGIYGDGVNIAARVEPQAEPGGVCVTQQVFLQIDGKIDCPVSHVGRRELKNIRNAPDLYLIAPEPVEGSGEKVGSSDGGAPTVRSVDAPWPRPPIWKYVVWWLVASIYPGVLLVRTLMPGGIAFWRDALGDSTLLVTAIVGLVPVGLLVAAHLASRLWARGTFNPWLQGRYFVVFPAACASLFVYHYVVLRGRIDSAILPVRSTSVVSPALEREITTSLTQAITLYANSYVLDSLLVAYLALMALLGYLFLPRKVGQPLFARRDWLVLAVGIGIMVVVGFVFREPLTMSGIGYVSIYLAWILCAVGILQSARRDGRPFACGLRAWLAGVVLAAALTSLLSILGFLRMLGISAARFTADMRPLVWKQAMTEIAEGHGFVRLLALFLFALLAVALRKGLRWDRAAPRTDLLKELGSAAVSVTLVVLPLVTFPAATREMHRALSLPVGGMVPAALGADAEPSFYVDRAPGSVGRFSRRMYVEMTGKDFDGDYRDDSLLDALTAGEECRESIRASLGEMGEAVPTVCLTAIEARFACEARGKRLLTPEEWDAAIANVPVADEGSPPRGGSALARLALGEWTMRLVHGTPVFEVRGADEQRGIPGTLAPTETSRKVGFRCAYAYEP